MLDINAKVLFGSSCGARLVDGILLVTGRRWRDFVDARGFLIDGISAIVVINADKQVTMKVKGSDIGEAGRVRVSDRIDFV